MTIRKWTSRAGAMALAMTALGALAPLTTTGCGGGAGANGSGAGYCDDTGCYQCDGYSCSSVAPPPGNGSDGGTTLPTADAGSATDGGPSTADSGPTCGDGNGPCGCTNDAQCAAGQTCVAGACTASSNACRFSSECPAGDVCADGRCVADCSAPGASCPAGSSCQKGACEPTPVGTPCTTGAQCGSSTPVCVAGNCSAACTIDSQCPTGDYCNQGACEVDARPKPNCSSVNDCLGGSMQACLGGYCRYVCSSNTQCAEIDARIAVCSATVADAGANGYCETSIEATPQCTSKSDCPNDEDCVSNVCK